MPVKYFLQQFLIRVADNTRTLPILFMELDPDISSAISLAELDSDFQPTEFQLNFDMPDLLMGKNDYAWRNIMSMMCSNVIKKYTVFTTFQLEYV